MRSKLIRGAAAIALAVALAGALWVFAGRTLSVAVDRAATVRLAQLPASPIGWNGVYLQVGEGEAGHFGPRGWAGPALVRGPHILDLTGPGPLYKPVAALDVDAGQRLVISAGGRTLVLGARAGALTGDDGPIPAFAAEPGNKARLTLERSWLSWPTPFETNFMTGYVPSWRRHLYYRLTWRKASGARLDMLWRLAEGWDHVNGWTLNGAPDDELGLIEVEIRAAPADR